MTDIVSQIYAKRDELQALINKGLAAGYRIQMPYGALQALTVSETGKVKSPEPVEAPQTAPSQEVASEEEPSKSVFKGGVFRNRNP